MERFIRPRWPTPFEATKRVIGGFVAEGQLLALVSQTATIRAIPLLEFNRLIEIVDETPEHDPSLITPWSWPEEGLGWPSGLVTARHMAEPRSICPGEEGCGLNFYSIGQHWRRALRKICAVPGPLLKRAQGAAPRHGSPIEPNIGTPFP